MWVIDAATASNPASSASCSPSPVRPTCRSQTLTTAVPRTPSNASSPPATPAPATRPCLLAVVPSGHVGRAVMQQVAGLAAVAGGPHAVHAGAHPRVDGDAAVWAERQARGAGQRRVGRTPTPTTTTSASIASPPAITRRTRSSPSRPSTGVPQRTSTPCLRELGGDRIGHVGVDERQQPRLALDDGRGQPARPEGLGHLEADVAAADDHRRARARASSIQARMACASSTVRSVNTPGSVAPGSRASTGRAPAATTSASHVSVRSRPASRSRTCSVPAAVSIGRHLVADVDGDALARERPPACA